jgi:hypothetical protein
MNINSDIYSQKDPQQRITNDVFAVIQGMMYDNWIFDRYATIGGLIESPIGIIESILRDWVFRVSNARTSTNATQASFVLTDPDISVDDYFNGSKVYSSSGWNALVGDYNGTTKVVTLNNSVTIADTDRLYFVNCNAGGTRTINEALFNSAFTSRSGWKFRVPLQDQVPSSSILNDLLFESHCIMAKQFNEYKIFPLDVKPVSGVFDSPEIINGQPAIEWNFTDLSLVYTEFQIEYDYDLGSGKYKKTIKVDKNGSTDSLLDSSYSTLCDNAGTKHRINKKYSYQSKFIADETTAVNSLEKTIERHTDRWLLVDYVGDIKNHIKYEIGDQVVINHPTIPTGVKSDKNFMINSVDIIPNLEQPLIRFQLTQLPGEGSSSSGFPYTFPIIFS